MSGTAPTEIVEAKGLAQISDNAALQAIIDRILDDNAEQVARYLEGQEKLRGFFVGQVMRQTKGKANPGLVNQLLDSALDAKK